PLHDALPISGAGEAAGAAAECLDAGRSAKTPCADAGSEVADGEPALRRWPAPARVPEAARQGRGLRVPADSRAGRQRREGPRHHAAAIGERAAPGTLSPCKDSGT